MARQVIEIRGADRQAFLQDLVSNDVTSAAEGLVYAALLTPQGKYLADFFLHETGEAILLDCDAAQAPGLLKRLTMYRLRRDVTLAESPLQVARGLGPVPAGAFPDPAPPRDGLAHVRPRGQ